MGGRRSQSDGVPRVWNELWGGRKGKGPLEVRAWCCQTLRSAVLPDSAGRERPGKAGEATAGGAGKSSAGGRCWEGRAGRGPRAGGGSAGRPISSLEPDGRETKRRPSASRLLRPPSLPRSPQVTLCTSLRAGAGFPAERGSPQAGSPQPGLRGADWASGWRLGPGRAGPALPGVREVEGPRRLGRDAAGPAQPRRFLSEKFLPLCKLLSGAPVYLPGGALRPVLGQLSVKGSDCRVPCRPFPSPSVPPKLPGVRDLTAGAFRPQPR